MRKYIHILLFILMFFLHMGKCAYMDSFYIDSTRWSVYDFWKQPLYGDSSNAHSVTFEINAIDFRDSLHAISAFSSGVNFRHGYMETNDG